MTAPVPGSTASSPIPAGPEQTRRVVILGAAGRDFHNFNVVFRDDPAVTVVAFTAAQIPGIANRRYPAELAGPRYPLGIPIEDEARLEAICAEHGVNEVVFAYSDVLHAQVMHLASRALAVGADFTLLGPDRTMLRASRPVIAITAVRTGCGKSQISRWLSRRLREAGRRVAVLRHPMPYGDLVAERVQRFASGADLDAARCSLEEREEYEPHLALGNLVFAGVDYAAILALAEAEADIIVWDGGNNDFPFIRPDLHIVLADALRPTQIATHHPGETVARMADVAVVNKVDAASAPAVQLAIRELRHVNPGARILRAASPVRLDDPNAVRGRRVIVVEDGPSLTHGGISHGAGYEAARAGGAATIVDPRPVAAPLIAEVYRTYPHIGTVLPAVGYSAAQLAALEATLNAAAAEVVVAATPVDLSRLIRVNKPLVRARYEFAEAEEPGLGAVIDRFLAEHPAAPAES
ncbi:MAG TPA: cyclic 2,3-diphosphoglycerate synthase [Stellaceae bacterium]|nr:cyclic 2,3-diphosphoglycerate synthase [Stellaceae bacterium]